ncbi:MAG: chloride channel protein family [Aliidongia sp.]|jgi:CIC family chloride channel protein|nr:chloride channel protein family [Aliidongia sp.]
MTERLHPNASVGKLRRWVTLVGGELRGFAQGRMRDDEIGLVALAALLGVGAGFGVVLLRRGIAAFHAVAFDIPLLGHLSDGYNLDWWRVLVMPCGGGLVIGALGWAIRRRRPRDIVDAIEANALYGGRMSLTDSINLAVMTLLSGGFGASVGLEAAYTQLGAGYCSRMGILLRLRRDDLRMLVGCGAAAAIAAAFNAPLAGAFYAFELVIGRYTLGNLAPVAVAALAGTLTARATFGTEPSFVVERPVHIAPADYLLFVVLGLACAGLSIVVMQGVTMTEQWFRRRSVPNWLRPGIGGFAVSAIALVYPQILGSGHGGIVANLHLGFALPYLIGLIAAKILASAISIGSGFRGGLFSAAIFIGSLFGSAASQFGDAVLPTLGIDPLAYTLVGMASVAAGIIGAPVTMILLVLEGSGDFSATIGVLVGVLTTTVAVRHWFGYSFATWRFHLRGLKIRSPEDVGWLDEFRVGRLMRTDPKSVPVAMSVASLRKLFPIGSTKRVFAVNGKRLAGIVDLIELHGPDLPASPEDLTAGDLAHPASTYLLPGEDVRTALQKFADAQSETLPVVDSAEAMEIIGYLTEAYALRRYNQELERRRAESEGDSGLFSAAVRPDG